MSTRLYLTNTAPGYTPTTKRGTWTTSSSTVARLLGRRPSGATTTSAVAETSTTNNVTVLLGRWISDPAVAAGTLAGNVQWVMGVLESSASANDFFYLHIYVTTGDSDTPRGTFLSNYTPGTGTEWPTTAAGATEGAVAGSSVSVSVGDRLVVEVGYQARNTSATSFTGTLRYGATGTTDLAAAATSVTTDPGWIEFASADGIWNTNLSKLVDTASAGSVDTTIWTATTGSVGVASGRLTVDANGYSYLLADPTVTPFTPWHLKNSSLFCEVAAVPTGANLYGGLAIQADGSGTFMGIYYHQDVGTLTLENAVGFADAGVVTITYDPVAHRWWRIRHDGTSAYYETAPDGFTWTTRRTVSTAPSWTNYNDLRVIFEAGDSPTAGDNFLLDNFNTQTLTAAPAGTAPAGASVTLSAATATAARPAGTLPSGGQCTFTPGTKLTATPVGVLPGGSPVGLSRESIFSYEAPIIADQTDGVAYSMGTRFKPTVDGRITHARWIFPTNAQPSGPIRAALYRVSDQVRVGFTTFDDPGVLGAWNEAAYPTPIDVAANVEYAAVIWTPQRYVATPSYPWPKVSGDLTTTGSSGYFDASPTDIQYPTSSFGTPSYFADVWFEPATGGTTLAAQPASTTPSGSLVSFSGGTVFAPAGTIPSGSGVVLSAATAVATRPAGTSPAAGAASTFTAGTVLTVTPAATSPSGSRAGLNTSIAFSAAPAGSAPAGAASTFTTGTTLTASSAGTAPAGSPVGLASGTVLTAAPAGTGPSGSGVTVTVGSSGSLITQPAGTAPGGSLVGFASGTVLSTRPAGTLPSGGTSTFTIGVPGATTLTVASAGTLPGTSLLQLVGGTLLTASPGGTAPSGSRVTLNTNITLSITPAGTQPSGAGVTVAIGYTLTAAPAATQPAGSPAAFVTSAVLGVVPGSTLPGGGQVTFTAREALIVVAAATTPAGTRVVFTSATTQHHPGILTAGSTRATLQAGTLPRPHLTAGALRGPTYTSGGG